MTNSTAIRMWNAARRQAAVGQQDALDRSRPALGGKIRGRARPGAGAIARPHAQIHQAPRSRSSIGGSPKPGRSRAPSSNSSTRSPCSSRSCCRRRRPMSASTRRPRRCSRSPTRPQKMLALGEERVAELIRTIGLYRTKAKNIIAPVGAADRAAWRRGAAQPRGAGGAARGRPQDRQRRAQRRLRRADDRGRHAYLPRRQPHRPGAGQNAARGRARGSKR